MLEIVRRLSGQKESPCCFWDEAQVVEQLADAKPYRRAIRSALGFVERAGRDVEGIGYQGVALAGHLDSDALDLMPLVLEPGFEVPDEFCFFSGRDRTGPRNCFVL